MKKIFGLVTILLASVLLLSACEGATPGADGRTEVTVMWGKTEVRNQFNDMVDAFNAYSEDYFVISIEPTDGVAEDQRIRFAGGDAINLIAVGSYNADDFVDYARDLSGELFTSLAMDGTLGQVQDGDRIWGMPGTVEGFSLIYNAQAIEEALGEPFDSSTIRTIDDFEAILTQLEGIDGIDPIAFLPSLHWSTSWHMVNTWVASQSPDYDEQMVFLNSLIDGTADLANNERFQGWLRIVELSTRYNTFRNAPLDADYDDGVMALADGRVAFWFQGDWAYPPLSDTNPDAEFGFLPVPLSNDPNDFGNSHISVDVPFVWVVDERFATEEQQSGSIAFLNWMVTNPIGQQYFVEELNLIPIFEGMDYIPEDALSQSIVRYLEQGNTMRWMNVIFGHAVQPDIGAGLEQYAMGLITLQEITAYVERAFQGLAD